MRKRNSEERKKVRKEKKVMVVHTLSFIIATLEIVQVLAEKSCRMEKVLWR